MRNRHLLQVNARLQTKKISGRRCRYLHFSIEVNDSHGIGQFVKSLFRRLFSAYQFSLVAASKFTETDGHGIESF